MLKTQDSAKVAKVASRLQNALLRLERVEEELREMEEGWGAPPTMINPLQYEHDWVAWNSLARARAHYAHLLEEREVLREMIRALRRWLKEVRDAR